MMSCVPSVCSNIVEQGCGGQLLNGRFGGGSLALQLFVEIAGFDLHRAVEVRVFWRGHWLGHAGPNAGSVLAYLGI